jgi:hypothetical protein
MRLAAATAFRRFLTVTLALALALGSCDGDGCHGGPNGPATKFCQEQIARLGPDASVGSPEAICAGCCVQEVHYVGTIKNGLCVCR